MILSLQPSYVPISDLPSFVDDRFSHPIRWVTIRTVLHKWNFPWFIFLQLYFRCSSMTSLLALVSFFTSFSMIPLDSHCQCCYATSSTDRDHSPLITWFAFKLKQSITWDSTFRVVLSLTKKYHLSVSTQNHYFFYLSL